MDNLFFFTAWIFILIGDLTASTIIECSFSECERSGLQYNSTYQCDLKNDPKINSLESAQISSVISENSKASFDDVVSFWAFKKTLIYFPRKLDKYFTNLEKIFIMSCHLKDFDQSDLKQFPNLKQLELHFNDIEIIEDKTFDFNPKLESVVIQEKNIFHIGPNVFDNLNHLRSIWLKNLICFHTVLPIQAPEKIKLIKENCTNVEYLSLNEDLKSLQNNKEFSAENFNSFEKKLENSSLFYPGTLWEKLENLKTQKSKNSIISVDPVPLNCDNDSTISNSSTVIECEIFKSTVISFISSKLVKECYDCCLVFNHLNISSPESAFVHSVKSVDQTSNNLNIFKDIFFTYKLMHFFPKGLNKFLKNLETIYIERCSLKEIHQADLKPFHKLKSFYLYDNEIQVIEEGLFDFNFELENIAISERKIFHIYPTVFNNLMNLERMWFENIPCFKGKINVNELIGVYESKRNIQKAIRIIKKDCSSSEFMSLNEEINEIELESKSLAARVENVDNKLNSSKLSKFRPFSNKLKNLEPLKAINKPALVCENNQDSANQNENSVSSGTSRLSFIFKISKYFKKKN